MVFFPALLFPSVEYPVDVEKGWLVAHDRGLDDFDSIATTYFILSSLMVPVLPPGSRLQDCVYVAADSVKDPQYISNVIDSFGGGGGGGGSR